MCEYGRWSMLNDLWWIISARWSVLVKSFFYNSLTQLLHLHFYFAKLFMRIQKTPISSNTQLHIVAQIYLECCNKHYRNYFNFVIPIFITTCDQSYKAFFCFVVSMNESLWLSIVKQQCVFASEIVGKHVWLQVLVTLFAMPCKVARFARPWKNSCLQYWHGAKVCKNCTISQNLLLAKLASSQNLQDVAARLLKFFRKIGKNHVWKQCFFSTVVKCHY